MQASAAVTPQGGPPHAAPFDKFKFDMRAKAAQNQIAMQAAQAAQAQVVHVAHPPPAGGQMQHVVHASARDWAEPAGNSAASAAVPPPSIHDVQQLTPFVQAPSAASAILPDQTHPAAGLLLAVSAGQAGSSAGS